MPSDTYRVIVQSGRETSGAINLTMAKAREGNTEAGTLHFPNPSRSYDGTGHGVRFWGYDQSLEVSLFVEEGALSKIDPNTKADEAGSLATFDANRDWICQVADHIYSRRRKAAHIFSYTLTDSDF